MATLAVEWLKTKHTPIRWFVFLTPILFAAALLGYFALRQPMENLQVFAFQAVFEVWTAFVIPLAAGVLSGFSIYQEELAGNFTGFLGTKLPRAKLYGGKLASLVWMMSASLMLGVLATGIGLSLIFHVQVSWTIWMAAAVLAIVGTLPLLALHLWASFAWGMGASIGIGGGGVLLAALMATSLGNTVWQFVPWAWPVRLSMLPGAYLLYTPGMHMPPAAISSGMVFEQAVGGLVSVAIVCIVALIGALIWFNRWEGRKGND